MVIFGFSLVRENFRNEGLSLKVYRFAGFRYRTV